MHVDRTKCNAAAGLVDCAIGLLLCNSDRLSARTGRALPAPSVGSPAMPELAFVAAALALARSHPQAPALDLLDLVMQVAQVTAADLGDHMHPSAGSGSCWPPRSTSGCRPAGWLAWTGPATDPVLRAAMLQISKHEVLGSSAALYAVSG